MPAAGGGAAADGTDRTGLGAGIGIGRAIIGGFTLTGGFARTGGAPTTGAKVERVVGDVGYAPRVITPRLPRTGELNPSPTVS
jgi:hypothetical protein